MRGNIDRTGLVLFVVTLAAVVSVGVLVAQGMGGNFNQSMGELCEDEYGDGWGMDASNEVLQCEHANGSTAEYPIETVTGAEDVFNLWKVAGAVLALSAFVSFFISLPKRPDE